MSDTINDGGPAFPLPSEPGFPAEMGMTLRDWFAGQALAGFLVNFHDHLIDIKSCVVMSYDAADELIKTK